MRYGQILNYIDTLNIQEGTSARAACPVCGGANTFSVTREYGRTLWQCFSASCPTKGVSSSNITEEGLLALIGIHEEHEYTFTVPEHFTTIIGKDKPMVYLADNGCIDAFNEHRADIRYDPRLDRVVFLVEREGIYYDASGRSMDRSMVPKWYRYGKSNVGFLCSGIPGISGKRCCVVEDCASACAVSCTMDGMALLGTNLLPDHVNELSQYDEVLIALDPDALDKGFKMQAELSSYVKCRTVITEDDPKYFKPERIKAMLA